MLPTSQRLTQSYVNRVFQSHQQHIWQRCTIGKFNIRHTTGTVRCLCCCCVRLQFRTLAACQCKGMGAAAQDTTIFLQHGCQNVHPKAVSHTFGMLAGTPTVMPAGGLKFKHQSTGCLCVCWGFNNTSTMKQWQLWTVTCFDMPLEIIKIVQLANF